MRIFVFIFLVFISSCTTSKKVIEGVKSERNNAPSALLQESNVQLAPPKLIIDSLLFVEKSKIEMAFGIANSEIYYSVNDTDYSKYTTKLELNNTTTLSVFAHKKGYINSDTLKASLIKSSNMLSDTEVVVLPAAHKNYPGKGARSLTDFIKGGLNFRVGSAWLGFQNEVQEINLKFIDSKVLNKIYLSCLSDHNAWIFLPKEIEIWEDKSLVSKTEIPYPVEQHPSSLEFIGIDVPNKLYTALSIRVRSLSTIPDWHQGKGTAPWLFIDEVIIE